MERFWNIVYYFAYRAVYRFYKLYKKIEPGWLLTKLLYRIPFIRNFQEKRGRTLSIMEKEIDEAFKNPEYGLSGKFAYALVVGGQFSVILGLIFCFPNRELPPELSLVFFIAVGVYDYITLLHKDKYLKNGRKFAKEPSQWKVKWKWISMGVILFQFFFFFFAAFVLNPYIKNP